MRFIHLLRIVVFCIRRSLELRKKSGASTPGYQRLRSQRKNTRHATHRHRRNFGPRLVLFTRSSYPSQSAESERLLRIRATSGLAHPLREKRLDRQAKLSAEPRTRLSRCSFRSPRYFFRLENMRLSRGCILVWRMRSEPLEAGIGWDVTGLPEV